MITELLHEVERLLLMGKTIDIITEGLRTDGGYAESLIREAHDECIKKWCKEIGTDDPVYARQLRTLRHLYDKSFKLNDFKTCLSIQKQIENVERKNRPEEKPARINAVSRRINKEGLKSLVQAEVAALLNRSTQTIFKWHDDGFPHKGELKSLRYNWYDIEKWRESKRGGATETAEGNPSDKEREQKAKADIAEMEAYTMAGETLDRAETVLEWSAFLGRLKESIRGISLRVAPRLEDGMLVGEREAIIGREIDQTLRDVVAELARTEEVA